MSDDEVGLGRCPAVTDGGHRCVYPVGEVVDVAAIRHLWLLDAPPPYAWTETP